LFPLQAGLGYAIVQTLFYSKRQVIVEGLTDYWILKAINGVLSEKNRVSLKSDVVIVPCGGVNKLLPLASLLLGHDIHVAVLLDGDEPGKRKGKETESKLLTKCLFINTFAGKEEAEIEDLFPEDIYLDAVKEAYPSIKTPIEFSSEELKTQCIAKRVEAAFERLGYKSFEKWGPSRVIVDWIREKPDVLPKETLTKFETICKMLNAILS
jgi:predicted ATP-dependent endonuclease of OLD family